MVRGLRRPLSIYINNNMAHNPYRHKSYSHSKKRDAYKARRNRPDYPKGGYNIVPKGPYAGEKRKFGSVR